MPPTLTSPFCVIPPVADSNSNSPLVIDMPFREVFTVPSGVVMMMPSDSLMNTLPLDEPVIEATVVLMGVPEAPNVPPVMLNRS